MFVGNVCSISVTIVVMALLGVAIALPSGVHFVGRDSFPVDAGEGLEEIYDPYKAYDITSAVLQTCAGCKLNRRPLIQQFISEDIPKYDGTVSVEYITGLDPHLSLRNKFGVEQMRVDVSDMSDEEIRTELEKFGISK